MINRISIHDAIRKSGYKSINGFRNWIKKKRLQVLYDEGCRKGYFIEAEFNAALEQQSNIYIKQKYGWSAEEFKAKIKVESELLQALDAMKNKSGLPVKNNSHYYPKQKHELNFLSRLTAISKINNNTK